jgi:hypothetical protein
LAIEKIEVKMKKRKGEQECEGNEMEKVGQKRKRNEEEEENVLETLRTIVTNVFFRPTDQFVRLF